MKRILILGAALFIFCGAIYATFLLGYKRGFNTALFLQSGTFIGTLDALDKIRAGDVTAGTQRIEALCFSSANTLYGNSVFRHDFPGHAAAKIMIDDLQHYRHTYRSNSVEWSPMETNLEKNLASWK